ncbi:Predicted nucleotidyltransferases [Mannheimia haemolytica]|uniref:Predicted nucleotidyltransferases n=1 Tax=Mannheimia haemolytica TaxID=75985 RepID=A0A3S4XIG5_MANHA|nr:nucleotidyltransferase domain-containing protein [Mannheimia haemolytica]VEI74034.1 Predicted nucleotidyltransferases [Mannheimia haemolytica]
MPNFGLSERATKTITDILAKYPEVEQAIIYGSRAKGNYREGSDVDLTFKGKDLTYDIVKRIWGDLDDSSSPYLFDLSIYDKLTNPNFIEHIDRVGKVFYQIEL